MSSLVESLARLFKAGKITETQVKRMLTTKKLTQEEYEYIISK